MIEAPSTPYASFAAYYDMLGWSEFSDLVYPYLEKFFRQSGGKPSNFLDLACGTGVLAWKLAEQKIHVTGIDISPDMIERARAKPSRNGSCPEFLVGDITDFELNRKFKMAGCFFDSVNHLKNREQIRKTFMCAANHLESGGWFLFDMVTKYGLQNWQDYYNNKDDHYYVAQEARFIKSEDKARVKIEAFINDGSGGTVHIREIFDEIYIPLDRAYNHLNQAGFGKIIVKPFPPATALEDAERVLFYAQR